MRMSCSAFSEALQIIFPASIHMYNTFKPSLPFTKGGICVKLCGQLMNRSLFPVFRLSTYWRTKLNSEKIQSQLLRCLSYQSVTYYYFINTEETAQVTELFLETIWRSREEKNMVISFDIHLLLSREILFNTAYRALGRQADWLFILG